jgi:hypothetical protein
MEIVARLFKGIAHQVVLLLGRQRSAGTQADIAIGIAGDDGEIGFLRQALVYPRGAVGRENIRDVNAAITGKGLRNRGGIQRRV